MKARNGRAGVLEICPYEPPRSGWVTRLKIVRRMIQDEGVQCEVLDIGPSRHLERPDCLCTSGPVDYLRKVWRFNRLGFTMHCHVNGEYFRGLLLACAAFVVGRAFRNRCIVTFHGGLRQRFLDDSHASLATYLIRKVFALSDLVICNSESIRAGLGNYVQCSRIRAIPAFSRQYLDYRPIEFGPPLATFLQEHGPILSTYVCFRDGFFLEVLVAALQTLIAEWPRLGLVVVGTGPRETDVEREFLRYRVLPHVYFAGDLDHDAFMTLLGRSDIHLRTPVTDGVSATVLEALSLGVPVVASQNGTRPTGVLTYDPHDAGDLARAMSSALENREQLRSTIVPDQIGDTVRLEADVLLGRAW